MAQARSGQLFSLQLTPMQIPEGVPASELTFATSNLQASNALEAQVNLRLVIHPGEPSEMVVRIHNLSPQRLRLTLQTEGDFPENWCQIGTEGSDLLPGQAMDAVLYFAIAPDWFEQPASRSQVPFKINYLGRLIIRAVEVETGRRQVETSRFQLYVRPRSLYLNFLPDFYRDIDFIGRFLKVFEQTFEPTVNTLDTLWAYLDPLTAPQSLLPFLAHWVGWDFDAPFTSDRQRFLIRHALQIYRWRGTRRGLRFYLHLATGLPLDEHLGEAEKHIGIDENFSQGFVLGVAKLGEDAILGGSRPYHFTVCLRPEADHPSDEMLVRTIIEQEKPAFCTYSLHIERMLMPALPVVEPALPSASR